MNDPPNILWLMTDQHRFDGIGSFGGGLAAVEVAELGYAVPVHVGDGTLGLPAEAHGVLILQMAAPVAVTNYLLAQRYGARPAEVAATSPTAARRVPST